MKLEVGMFIRTPLGIDKIECFNKENVIGYGFITKANHYLLWHKEDNKFSIDGECFEKEEIKTSHNIIDIVQVGDYVNGYKITDIDCYEYETELFYDTGDFINSFVEEQIKSIITKEQMEQMVYKVVSE